MTPEELTARLGLGMTLFPYQLEGVRAIVKTFGGRALLGDEMGLGKSCQAIVTARVFKAWPLVVVCPATLKMNWKNELLAWLPSDLTAVDICVVKTGKDPLYGKVLVFSYEMAAKRSMDILAFGPKMVVLDESHYIKNKTALRTKALIPVCRSVPYCVLCTGTPVLNRPVELWSQLEALNRSLGKYWDFARKFCALRRGRFGWDATGASNLPLLNQLLRKTCLVRRLKKDVLKDLPPKRRQRIIIEGAGKETDAAVLRMKVSEVLAKAKYNRERALQLLRGESVKLSEFIFKAYTALGLLKVDAACEWLVSESSMETPVVVFYHHVAVGDAMEAATNKVGLPSMRIDGSTPLERRQAAVDAFQGGKLALIYLSLTAASTGITLTRSSDMLVVELPFGPGLAAQAEDRIHRIGQKNGALIRYLTAERTLDDSLWGLINKKSRIIHGVLDGADVSSFTADTSSQGGYWSLVEAVVDELLEKYNLSHGLQMALGT